MPHGNRSHSLGIEPGVDKKRRHNNLKMIFGSVGGYGLLFAGFKIPLLLLPWLPGSQAMNAAIISPNEPLVAAAAAAGISMWLLIPVVVVRGYLIDPLSYRIGRTGGNGAKDQALSSKQKTKGIIFNLKRFIRPASSLVNRMLRPVVRWIVKKVFGDDNPSSQLVLTILWANGITWQALGWDDAKNGIPLSCKRIGKVALTSLPFRIAWITLVSLFGLSLGRIFLFLFNGFG